MAQSTTTGLDAVPSMQRDSAAKSKDTAVSERKEFLRTTRARTAAAAATNRCGQHAAAPAGADADLPPFESLCNDGSAWEWGNLRVKIYRWTILCIKQVYLIFMTLSCPTNHLMLTFRTMTRGFGEPNSNADHLADRFRSAVIPRSKALHEAKSPLVQIYRWFLETPFLGIPGIVRFIDVRTQWFDEAMNAAIDNGIKQVVIIAAGYDTRAYRLSRPGVRFYEIDLPHASKHKQDLVRELLPASEGYSRPEFIAADLSKIRLADALATSSFDPSQPTLFTAEGLIYYLPPDAVGRLLECVSNSSAPGSLFMTDFLHLSCLSGHVWNPGFETLLVSVWNKGETMYSGIDERPAAIAALLARYGFAPRELLTAQDMVARYMPHVEYRGRPKATVSPYFGYFSAVKM